MAPKNRAEHPSDKAIFGSDETFARPSRAAVVQRPRKANMKVRRENAGTAERWTPSWEKATSDRQRPIGPVRKPPLMLSTCPVTKLACGETSQ